MSLEFCGKANFLEACCRKAMTPQSYGLCFLPTTSQPSRQNRHGIPDAGHHVIATLLKVLDKDRPLDGNSGAVGVFTTT